MRRIFLVLISLFSATSFAAEQSGASSCQSDLKNLIVPSIKTAMPKKDISAELAENDGGVYKVRLFVAADNPNKQVSIGWVVLDTNKSSAYDITRDDEHPDKLNLDAGKYKSFSDKCLKPANKDASQAIAGTRLPFAFDRYFQCATGAAKADECADRFHAYPVSALGSELRSQIDSSMDTVLFLPPVADLKVVLAGRAETDVNIYILYVFRSNKVVAKQTVGKMDGDLILTFDISKDYLITTYERKGGIQSKIRNVAHLKMDNDGKFLVCTSVNPTCK
ncbi:hypothetical protein GN109_17725 [Collimonas pratensis]|uniref:hypothetical protein n=1 Tax=Collimonas pratensis TaxID=279113 RepID=UPI00143D3166|nr:hypothetical protein [Collimonas pratensis]NKI71266.1 hypothetical protein [Collimonas pratensis]